MAAVYASIPRLTDKRVDGGGQHHGARALLEHLAADVLGAVVGSGEDHSDDPVPDRIVKVGRPIVLLVDQGDADRVVEQHINAPVTGNRAVHQGLDRLDVAHVEMAENRRTAGFGDRRRDRLAPLPVDVGDDDGRPGLGHQLRACPADPGSSTCHDGNFVVEQVHDSNLPLNPDTG